LICKFIIFNFYYQAQDGGYVLLGVPSHCPLHVFGPDVLWSSIDTCATQIKSLERAGLECVIGNMYFDVDEFHDIRKLLSQSDSVGRLCPRTINVIKDIMQ
jgi:glycosyltransferase A (GT-A) superfamily protein (DUF2064 family)